MSIISKLRSADWHRCMLESQTECQRREGWRVICTFSNDLETYMIKSVAENLMSKAAQLSLLFLVKMSPEYSGRCHRL